MINCNLKAENYLTDDVIELAINMIENIANKMIYDEFKKLERKYRQGFISFKAEKPSNQKPEEPLIARIELLEIEHYECCSKDAKIKLSSKFAGSYCPFCGGIQDGKVEKI